jgi:hypothetical protein
MVVLERDLVLDPKMEFKLSIDDTKAVEAGPDPV